jgi:hypothetical protein
MAEAESRGEGESFPGSLTTEQEASECEAADAVRVPEGAGGA